MLTSRVLRPLAARSLPCLAPASSVSVRAAGTSSSSTPGIPAHLNTKRPDVLLKFKHASTVREVYHLTSYALAAGVPLALMMGSPASFPIDLALGLIIPLHTHIGMRSVIVDYVADVPSQRIALAVLACVTVLTAAGLTKLNLSDKGITATVTGIWTPQTPQRAAGKPSLL